MPRCVLWSGRAPSPDLRTFPDRAIEICIWAFVVARRGLPISHWQYRVSRNVAKSHTRLRRGMVAWAV